MNEIPNILEAKENVEWEGRPKASAYYFSLFFGAIFLSLFLSLFIFLGKLNYLWFMGVGAIFLIMIFIGILAYSRIHYAITNKRVILQKGIIGRDFKSVDYDQIQNVSVDVGLIGVMFGVGTIKIFTGEMEATHSRGSGVRVKGIYVGGGGGGTRAKYDLIKNIPNHYEILKRLQEHLSKRKEDLYAGRT